MLHVGFSSLDDSSAGHLGRPWQVFLGALRIQLDHSLGDLMLVLLVNGSFLRSRVMLSLVLIARVCRSR